MNRIAFVYLMLVLGIATSSGIAQSLTPEYLGTAGGFRANTDISLSWSVGEMAIDTRANNGSILTEGFQQPELPVIHGIRNNESETPSFTLHENHPNPFNPSTTISFTLQKDCRIVLRIYNGTGTHLKTLADGLYTAGKYNLEFNAGGLPSGTYYYTLESGGQRIQRSMTVVK